MALFWKAAAGVLITLVLSLAIGSQSRDLHLLLTITACTMVGILAMTYLEPVLDYLRELDSLSPLQTDMLTVLLRAAGIGLTAEVIGMICMDAGNASLGKTVQLLGSAVILCMSLPIVRTMLDLIRKLLGDL